MKTMDLTQEEVKHQILDAAFARFAQYGMGKTTMVEIAKDCGMSAGNLYRYYENKTDIAADSCKRCLSAKEKLLREVLQRPGLNVGQRLETLVLDTLRYMHGEFSAHPKLFELVMHISSERMELVEKHFKVLQSFIAEVFSEGNKSGEFDVPDVLTAAENVLVATIKFMTPHFMTTLPLDQLEQEAKGVVELLIRGLAKS